MTAWLRALLPLGWPLGCALCAYGLWLFGGAGVAPRGDGAAALGGAALLGALGAAWARRHDAGALALVPLWCTGNLLLIWQTLRRSEWAFAAGSVAALGQALGAAAAAAALAHLVERASRGHRLLGPLRWALGSAALVAGLAMAYGLGGPLPKGQGPAPAPGAQPWVAAVQADLRAGAAGLAGGGWAAAAAALQHGAEAATLRQLCPAHGGRGRDAARWDTAPGEALGRRLCAAVAAPQAEVGAGLLGCPGVGRAPEAEPVPAEGGDLAKHRCRLAGELLAEAGLMQQAAWALRQAGPPGRAAAWALWQERQLEAPPWLPAPAPRGLSAWPQGATIGPKQLGFAQNDRPGTLTWHPAGPGPLGALCARSPYRGALVTHVPLPTAGPAPTGAAVCLRGAADLAITLEGPGGAQVLRCAGPNGGAAPAQLPAAACSGAWTTLHLGPPPGAPHITAARIHGEFLLARWAWQGAHEAPP